MILAVGERIHDKKQAGREQWWRDRWIANRQRHIMAMPAMTLGGTRARLEKLLGLPRDTKVVNLLWPDAQIGTWDAEEARNGAMAVMSSLANDDGYDRLALLGRKVAAAFRLPDDAEWGSRWTIKPDGLGWEESMEGEVIVLPHPSGRSRTLNDEAMANEIRSRVKEFLR